MAHNEESFSLQTHALQNIQYNYCEFLSKINLAVKEIVSFALPPSSLPCKHGPWCWCRGQTASGTTEGCVKPLLPVSVPGPHRHEQLPRPQPLLLLHELAVSLSASLPNEPEMQNRRIIECMNMCICICVRGNVYVCKVCKSACLCEFHMCTHLLCVGFVKVTHFHYSLVRSVPRVSGCNSFLHLIQGASEWTEVVALFTARSERTGTEEGKHRCLVLHEWREGAHNS